MKGHLGGLRLVAILMLSATAQASVQDVVTAYN